MPDPDLTAATLAQFGVAGLMGWMWLTERRTAAARDRQLGEAHDRLLESRTQLNVLLSALDQNTRALTAIDIGQRRAVELLERFCVAPAASTPTMAAHPPSSG